MLCGARKENQLQPEHNNTNNKTTNNTDGCSRQTASQDAAATSLLLYCCIRIVLEPLVRAVPLHILLACIAPAQRTAPSDYVDEYYPPPPTARS